MVADRELHCELRLSLNEKGTEEENKVREALGPSPGCGYRGSSAAQDLPGPSVHRHP